MMMVILSMIAGTALAAECPDVTGEYSGVARVPLEKGVLQVPFTAELDEQDECNVTGKGVFTGSELQAKLGGDVEVKLDGSVTDAGKVTLVVTGQIKTGTPLETTLRGSFSAQDLVDEEVELKAPSGGDMAVLAQAKNVFEYTQKELSLKADVKTREGERLWFW